MPPDEQLMVLLGNLKKQLLKMIAICASQSAKSFHAKMFYVRFSYKNYLIHFSYFCNTVFFYKWLNTNISEKDSS